MGKLPHTWLRVTAHIEQYMFPGDRRFLAAFTRLPSLHRTAKGSWVHSCLFAQYMTVKNDLSSKLKDQANKHIRERFVPLMLKVKDYLYCTVIVHWGIFFQAVNNVLYYHCITYFQETRVLQYKDRSILVKIHLASPPTFKKTFKKQTWNIKCCFLCFKSLHFKT